MKRLPINLSSCIAFLLVPCSLLAQVGSAMPKLEGEYIDIKLPITEEITEQWIVIVQRGEMEILPAKARREDDGLVISAHSKQKIGENALRGAVARTADGKALASPLKAPK